MQTSDDKWNEQMENFNLKLRKLKNDVIDYKKISQTHLCKNREVFIPTVKYEIKKEFSANNNNNNNNNKNKELSNGIYKLQKRRLGRCLLKDTVSNASLKYMKSANYQNNTNTNINNTNNNNNINNNNNNNGNKYIQNNKNIKFNYPICKENSKKIVKTNQTETTEMNYKNGNNYIMRNKRKTEGTNELNEKSCNITKIKQTHKENINSNNLKDHTILNKKSRKTKLLYLEDENGKIVIRHVYRDKDIGFHNITKMDDVNLLKVKKENRDDDDIKTSKHLAQWSSDLVNKYIKETIDKTKTHFLLLNPKIREEEILQRLRQ